MTNGNAIGTWPWVCKSCGLHYAAFRVYARWGLRYREVAEFVTCGECGPSVPASVKPPHGGWTEIWHTILRPVPEMFDPKTNPYPGTDPAPKKENNESRFGNINRATNNRTADRESAYAVFE